MGGGKTEGFHQRGDGGVAQARQFCHRFHAADIGFFKLIGQGNQLCLFAGGQDFVIPFCQQAAITLPVNGGEAGVNLFQ